MKMGPDQSVRPEQRLDIGRLKKRVAVRFVSAFLVLGLVFFWPAGTFRYWQAWTYMALLSILMLGAFAYLIRKDPELLERRMRAREKESRQVVITSLSTPVFFAIFLLPGFDRRYGWSSVPVLVVIAADILALAGYGLFVRVLRENSYASRIVEVEENQKVVTTGPYALVRHPMYIGIMVMFVFTPLALGSYWAVLPALMVALVLVARIVNEEKVLLARLPGYREYTQRVRYRLIPGIW
jgi:protein-S-isoprenylcysteine O-methyltransferase Ste14